MRSKKYPPRATFESAWALVQENAQSLKVMEKENKKERKERKESMKAMKEKEEMERKEWKESMKAMQKELGGISKSNGEEEPFMPLPTLNLDLSKRYTYADYLTWLDDVRRELIDGFIHLMSAPVRIHARITSRLNYTIEKYIVENKGHCHVYHAPFDVRIPKDGYREDNKIYNVVQPDICVICDLSKLDDRGCIGAPDLIVEVLSPSTFKKDWNYKFNLYEKVGVREYWIVDPTAKTVHVFLLQPNGYYDNGTVYECTQKAPVHIFEGLEVDLKVLFEE